MGGGGTLEGGEEVLDEEGVRELVDAELVLVAVLGGAAGDGHDAGVADEDVQPGGLGEEGLAGGVDGGEGGLVAGEEGDGGQRGDGSRFCNDGGGAGGVAPGEVDVCWCVLGEGEDGLSS